MKRFDLFFYLFIFGSMAISAFMAPAMFIQQNALAGWLWVGVFVLLLLMLLYGAIKSTVVEGAEQYKTWLGTIIAWVCIIGQWIILFVHPNNSNSLFYVLGLMVLSLSSIYFGFWAERHSNKHALRGGWINGKTHKKDANYNLR